MIKSPYFNKEYCLPHMAPINELNNVLIHNIAFESRGSGRFGRSI